MRDEFINQGLNHKLETFSASITYYLCQQLLQNLLDRFLIASALAMKMAITIGNTVPMVMPMAMVTVLEAHSNKWGCSCTIQFMPAVCHTLFAAASRRERIVNFIFLARAVRGHLGTVVGAQC